MTPGLGQIQAILGDLDWFLSNIRIIYIRMSHRALLVITLLLYGITAWFSEGYHHPDEHFQVLELAHYKLGRSPASDLPWEFEAQIRPGLQPAIAYTMIRAAEMTGINNPFTQAFLMRLCSGWLCLWIFWAWAGWLEKDPAHVSAGKWLRWSVLLLWFVPYLSVRFSSENMAGLSFAAGGLLLLQNLENTNSGRRSFGLFCAGFLLGLSFFFRFQMGFALLGAGAWLLWKMLMSDHFLKPLRYLLPGFLMALLAGVGTDTWLYGKFTVPAYNYFVSNVIDDKAAYWGTSPWWYYLRETLLTAVPPVSAFLLFFLFLGIWMGRKHLLVWSLLPFLLAHFVVGHKELRFMFPMLLPVLVLSVWGMREVEKYLSTRVTVRRWYSRLFALTLTVNGLLLVGRCLLTAQESVACFRFLYDYTASKPAIVYSHKKMLYEVVGLNMNFYRAPNIKNEMYVDIKAKKIPAGALLLSQDLQLKNPPENAETERIYAYFPDWILHVNMNDWQSRTRMWSLHIVHKKS